MESKTPDTACFIGPAPDAKTDLPPNALVEFSCGGRTRIEWILQQEHPECLIGQTRKVCGWSKTVRKQGGNTLVFIMLNDGSSTANLQVVVGDDVDNFKELTKCGVSCSFEIVGIIKESPAEGQAIELHVGKDQGHYCKILGKCDASRYPLSKKGHSKEFLREIAHLRVRSYFFSAVTRVRNEMAYATHSFFQSKGYKYIHTPLITAADCEGAGEMFQVTTMLPNNDKMKEIATVKDKGYDIDYKQDFFGRKTFLTVSGQLALENFAHGLSDVYTFGPTFRAENSNTSRHLSEFWMIEPEICFADLNDIINLAQEYVQFCVKWALTNCSHDVKWLQDNNGAEGLVDRLENVRDSAFTRITYTDAIELLKEHVREGKKTFEVAPEWGLDLGSEHERYLCETVYGGPTVIFNYPKDFKAFYMKFNDDHKTVQACDILVPGIGELIGGSVREENLELLDVQLKEKGICPKDLWWYRELRQWGGVPHAGFGLGFERLIMLVTGVENIRDTIPYPRYPGNAEF